MIEVSIIIPTYNRVNSLEKTLKSLFNQKFPSNKYEIIVCDDGSTDGTENIVKELIKTSPCDLRYFKQENKGPAAARNLGISQARGDIIGFIDDDCVASPIWIEAALPYFNEESVCSVQGVTLPLQSVSIKNKIFNYAEVVTFTGKEKINYYPSCNIFYQKKHLIEIGCFDEELQYGEDTDLGIRLKEKGYRFNLSPKAVVYHEVRYTNLITYILKRKRRIEAFPLFVKKHPEFRNTFTLGYIHSRTYPVMLIISLFFWLLKNEISYLFALLATISYLRSRVFLDLNLKMYPLRIVGIYKYFLLDLASMYYLLKGSIRYRCLVI